MIGILFNYLHKTFNGIKKTK